MEYKRLSNSILVSFITVLYLALSARFIGFKIDQLFLAAVFNLLYYLTASTRKFILGFLIFIVFWIIFDSMKLFPNYLVNDIHIKDLYQSEKSFFGINDHGTVLTPNEYAQKYSITFLDVLTGFFYINWMPIPLIFAFYLFRKNRMQFLQFALAFLFVNLLGFVVYYAFPAAPPWYVKEYGFEVHFNTPGNTAGLARFDDFFGIKLFHGLYAKSSNVFAAMPSLHSAYPIVVLFFGLKNKLGPITVFFAVFMMGTWFSAVYTGHHYVLDVLAGIACALTGLLLFEKLLLKTKWFNSFLNKYKTLIS
ncbi:PA-phosphatase [Sphingobacteriaceae bacterium]|nr:PA-phosphatase [Sphingobacteriaceae bacterium]